MLFYRMTPIEVLLRLVCVVSCLVHDIPQIDQLVENGRLNVNILQHVQTVLRERQRDDVLDIIHRTMAGKRSPAHCAHAK